MTDTQQIDTSLSWHIIVTICVLQAKMLLEINRKNKSFQRTKMIEEEDDNFGTMLLYSLYYLLSAYFTLVHKDKFELLQCHFQFYY